MMMFKNPYDESNDLKSHERLFLKKVLFYINKVKESILDAQNNNMGIAFNSELEVEDITYNIYDILLGQGIYRFFIQ